MNLDIGMKTARHENQSRLKRHKIIERAPNSFESAIHKFPHTNLQSKISQISYYKGKYNGELTKLPRGDKLPGIISRMISGILISRIFSVHITP